MKTRILFLFLALTACLSAAPSDPIFTNPKIKGVSAGSAINTDLLHVDSVTGVLTRVSPDFSLYAPLLSPTFTGIQNFTGTSTNMLAGVTNLGSDGTEVLNITADTHFLSGSAFTFDGNAGDFATALGITANAFSFLQAPSSSSLATAVADATGTESLVLQTSPTFKTSVKINNPANTFAYTLTPAAIGAARTLNLPLTTGTDTLACLGLAQTFSGVQTMTSPTFKTSVTIRNPADTFSYTLTPAAIAATRVLNLPLTTGTDTLACLGLAQTFTGVQTMTSPLFKTDICLNNPANTFKYLITPAAIAADRTLNMPLTTGTDTLATLGMTQTFSGQCTFSSASTYVGTALYAQNGTSGGTLYSYASSGGKYIGINTNGTTHKLFTVGADDVSICTSTSTVAGVFKDSGAVFDSKGGRIKKVTVDTSTSLTLTNANHVVTLSNAGAVTLNLPVGVTGTEFVIKNKGAGTVTITPNGSQKVFTTAQAATFTRTTGQACVLIFDGTDWSVVSDY